MLTAKDALKLNETKNREEALIIVNRLLSAVKDVSKTKTYLLAGLEYKEDYMIWSNGGATQSKAYEKVRLKCIEILSTLGYTTFYMYAYTFVVKPFTIVSWDKPAEEIAKCLR